MRKTKTLLLALLMGALMGATAGAAETTVKKSGFYNIGTPDGFTVTAQDANGSSVTGASAEISSGSSVTLHENSVKLAVHMNSVAAGEYVVILADGSALPTQSSAIRYIDQQSLAADGALDFTVYPILPENAGSMTEMTLYITSDKLAQPVNVPVCYASAGEPYQMGDVNRDNLANSADALLVLQYSVADDESMFDDQQKHLANMNGDELINSQDALLILQKSVSGQK